jgi:hypothetical protein
MDDFPIKNRKRAKRRYMKQKMKSKARKIAKYVWGWGRRSWFREDDIEHFACHAADNLKLCSCEMCRNPRRNGEKTIQEKRMEESFKEQLNS